MFPKIFAIFFAALAASAAENPAPSREIYTNPRGNVTVSCEGGSCDGKFIKATLHDFDNILSQAERILEEDYRRETGKIVTIPNIFVIFRVVDDAGIRNGSLRISDEVFASSFSDTRLYWGGYVMVLYRRLFRRDPPDEVVNSIGLRAAERARNIIDARAYLKKK